MHVAVGPELEALERVRAKEVGEIIGEGRRRVRRSSRGRAETAAARTGPVGSWPPPSWRGGRPGASPPRAPRRSQRAGAGGGAASPLCCAQTTKLCHASASSAPSIACSRASKRAAESFWRVGRRRGISDGDQRIVDGLRLPERNQRRRMGFGTRRGRALLGRSGVDGNPRCGAAGRGRRSARQDFCPFPTLPMRWPQQDRGSTSPAPPARPWASNSASTPACGRGGPCPWPAGRGPVARSRSLRAAGIIELAPADTSPSEVMPAPRFRGWSRAGLR